MTSFLLVSPKSRIGSPNERPAPLTKLILPLSQVNQKSNLPIPGNELWWAEWNGNKLMLRGYGIVARIFRDKELYEKENLVIQLDSATSERLTIPGRKSPQTADITFLVQRGFSLPINKIQLVELSEELYRQLSFRKSILGETTCSYSIAMVFYDHLFKKFNLSKQYPQLNSLSGNLMEAQNFVRQHLVRSELISVGDVDSYYVAASALAGYTELPTDLSNSTMYSVFPPFHGLKNAFADPSICLDDLDDEISPFLQDFDNNNIKHQVIVNLLNQVLEQYGLSTVHNRFVDLKVSYLGRDILFEVKTASAESFLKQVRLAVGQLLEYRFRYKHEYGEKSVKLVAVIEKLSSSFMSDFIQAFLSDLGIGLLLWDEQTNTFEGLASILN